MDSIGPDWKAREFLFALATVLGPYIDQVALIGGLAVNQLRRPRFTDDVDFMALSGTARTEGITSRFAADGYSVVNSFGGNLPSGPDFIRLMKPGSQVAVELMTAKTDFQEMVVQRAREVDEELRIRVATAEDLIVLKLIANRSQDHLDLLELGRAEALDWAYIEHWAHIWDLADRLASLRKLLARPE